MYWGKLAGFLLGTIVSKNILGSVAGFLLGHSLDILIKGGKFTFLSGEKNRSLFFKTTFQIMGHVSKAKGHISESDIRVATFFMNQMHLKNEKRQEAQEAFREGKTTAFPLRETLQNFRQACFGRSDLIRVFLDIQIQAAFADGVLHEKERTILFVLAEELQINKLEFQKFLNSFEAGNSFFGQGRSENQQSGRPHSRTSTQSQLADAYKIIGVQSSDEPAAIKRSYRKLMNQYHPDKLVARGVPSEMIEIATQKTQSIQAAYDLIKSYRNFK